MKTKHIVLTGVLMALVCVATMILSMPLPTDRGYLNLGDSLVMSFATVLPAPLGMLVGGLGSALADVLMPNALIYAPGTFVIKALEAGIVYITYKKLPKPLKSFLPFILGGLFMISMYSLYEYLIITGNIKSIPLTFVANLPQGIASAIIAGAITPALQRIKKYIQ